MVSIFEACNFQDLTGQRIKKVMTTMKFIENHITVMMDIWGGVDAIKAHAPPIVDTREGDAKLAERPQARRRRRPCLAGRHRRAVRLSVNSASKKSAGLRAGVFYFTVIASQRVGRMAAR